MHKKTFDVLPRHIAVIMDGNGRWAKKRHLPRTAGHSVGAKTFKSICLYANEIGVEYMTFYAFSTENWRRPKEEVDALMKLFTEYLSDSVNFKDKNIRLKFIGDRSVLSGELQKLMSDAEENSKDCTGLTVNLAINYGGRDEIVHAAREIAKQVKNGGLSPEDITADTVENNLYTAGNPPVDLVIRPGGEYRVSNFLIWQLAYSELWFSNVLWPNFKPKHLDEAIESFARRNRRFGGV